jgi:hypothetical protein
MAVQICRHERQGPTAIGNNNLRDAVMERQAVRKGALVFDDNSDRTAANSVFNETVAVCTRTPQGDETITLPNPPGIIPEGVNGNVLRDGVPSIRRLVQFHNLHAVQKLTESHSINPLRL